LSEREREGKKEGRGRDGETEREREKVKEGSLFGHAQITGRFCSDASDDGEGN
jgi:hypothetical protein